MIDEPTEELASLYVFGLLEHAEASAFDARLETDAELRRLVGELRETAASIAHVASPRTPPADLEGRLMDAIRSERKVFPSPPAWIPWALAAGFAVAFVMQWSARQKLEENVTAMQQKDEASRTQMASLNTELDEMKRRDKLAAMQIATLTSKLENAPEATGVVIWDEKEQKGVVRLDQLPHLDPDRDYQLWVIDPQYEKPVSAGVIRMADYKNVAFQVKLPIANAKKFAVSIEQKGGVPEAQGPIVLISN